MLPENPRGLRPARHSKRRRATITLSITAAIMAGGLVALTSCGHAQSAVVRPAADKTMLDPPSSWKLDFNSDFAGDKLNKSTWATCYPWSPNGCSNFGSGNDEKEWYQASQVQMKNGILNLIAKRTPTAGRNAKGEPKEYACRSGMISTYPGFRFTYGYIQIIARVPYGAGLWPALWLAAANKQWPPEIDILEHWASDAEAKVYLHPKVGIRQGGPVPTPAISEGWHSFTLYWTKSRLTWYVDGGEVFTTTTNIPAQSMYLIANVADTSSSVGSCSGTMLIKSVKVWQPKS